MRGTHSLLVRGRGRIVIPAEVRERMGFGEGTPLILVETPAGLLLLTREQLRDRVRHDLAGVDLVAELLSIRRKSETAEGQQVRSISQVRDA